MLVTCQNCGVQFAFEASKCISCGVHYQVGPQDFEEVVAPRVADWLKAKNSKEHIRSRLIDEYGVSDTDTQEILRMATARVRAGNREHGGKIAAGGCLLMFGAAVLLVVTGGLVFGYGAGGVGLAMLLVGLLKRVTGWNITGHDDD